MSNFIRMIAAAVVSLGVTSPLLYEPWFTWRVWLVLSMLIGLRYYCFCIAQGNLQTVATAIIRSLSEIIGRIGGRQSD